MTHAGCRLVSLLKGQAPREAGAYFNALLLPQSCAEATRLRAPELARVVKLVLRVRRSSFAVFQGERETERAG